MLITINPNGALSTQIKSTQPYDGADDMLVGVMNKSGATVFGISLSGNQIFGFDGDGLCAYISCSWPHPTGYEGPNMSFSPTNANSGIVNFTGTGLADGGFTFFSLEQAPTASVLGASVTIDPGHGLDCPSIGQLAGTTGGGLREDDLTVSVGLTLQSILKAANYDVAITKTDVQSCPDWKTRGDIAKHARSNLLVSVHFDKPSATLFGFFLQTHGSEGIYNSSKSSAAQLATFLPAKVSASLGIGSRGPTVDNSKAIIKPTVTPMTSAIIEVGRLSGPDLTAIQGVGSVGKAAAGIKAAIDAFIAQ